MPIYQSGLSGSYTWTKSLTKSQLCRKCPEDVMILGITQRVMISEAPGENPGKAIRNLLIQDHHMCSTSLQAIS